ncbi:MAG: molybdopterin-dependent oxidoreductase, partial [Desulfobacterales bacterium]|nr:molybdopterin-dependent oxidoreductase [Desulfobacterales bacterium]
PMPNYEPLEQANPFMARDLSKCILCGKCIRADHELVVVGAIDYNRRGFKSRPATAHAKPLEASDCTFCGTCLALCPTGALALQNEAYVGTPEREADAVCGFCGVGCALVLGVRDDRVVEVNPAERADSVNGATLCVRGHFAHDFLDSTDRLRQPLIRAAGDRGATQLEAATWDGALDHAARKFLDVKARYGPQSIGFLGSSKCTNEENYLFQKLARGLLGTNNVDNGSYAAGHPTVRRLAQNLPGRFGATPLDNLQRAELIFVLGAAPDQSAPVVGYHVKRAAQLGIPLIVADPRETDLVKFASVWLRLIPQSDLELLNGLGALCCSPDSNSSPSTGATDHNLKSYSKEYAAVDPQQVVRATGIDADTFSRAVGLLAGKRVAFVVGQGVLQQRYALQILEAALRLSALTGGATGGGGDFFILSPENNQTGAWDMGAVPDWLPGRAHLSDEGARRQWERRWQRKLSPDPGLDLLRMIEETEKGNLKALYILGENPLRSLPQPDRLQETFRRLEFILVQDILAGETTRLADVVLPGAAFAEKAGSFTNLEGRVQSFDRAVPPPGAARADWEILLDLAGRMGDRARYDTLEAVQEEIRRFVPAYAALRGGGHAALAWADTPENQAGDPPTTAGSQVPPIFIPPVRKPDTDYPYTAILGSPRHHLGSGTRTSRSKRIRALAEDPVVEMAPEDAQSLGLAGGDRVRVASRNGAVTRAVCVSRRLSTGLLYVPLAVGGNDAMRLIPLSPMGSAAFDGWKSCPVRVEAL